MARLRELKGILKDKASLFKANLSTNRPMSFVNVTVLRATTHSTTSPPSEHRLIAVLSLGHRSSIMADACTESIMNRLHRTHSPYVALKCLIIIHNIISKGSIILKNQLPSAGGYNFLHLSEFDYKSNVEKREISLWVRWYAGFLELNLMASRVLGYFSSSSSPAASFPSVFFDRKKDLLKEMNALVGFIEGICEVPDSLHLQRNDLLYELMILVGEDYRAAQYQIISRLSNDTAFADQISRLSSTDSSELIDCLKRLENCKKRLTEIFVNRKRYDAFWELINERKMELEEMNGNRGRLLVWKEREGMTS
ncbi:putative clathrin assembly protein At4g40080 [Olea europaea var. sylvestris]|uniref:putative clathrin assembly protein At4g40080 n=1 Tax=Olea europaea var. sylvestris TaxID=158386 RepID=UPI000C1D8705|nr:putative clathrin assembly protein At4g40080 [Olea europaea var. sylvestris]